MRSLRLALLLAATAAVPAHAAAPAPALVTLNGVTAGSGLDDLMGLDPDQQSINRVSLDYTCNGKAPRLDSDLRTATAGGEGAKALLRLGVKAQGTVTLTAKSTRTGESASAIHLKPARVVLSVRARRSGERLTLTGTYRITQKGCAPPAFKLKVSGPATVPCPTRSDELIRGELGVVYHDATHLKSCTIAYGLPARTFTLGPWAEGTKASWDATEVAWTVPDAAAPGTDRVWAASAGTGTQWLAGVQATPAAPATVVGLKVFGESAGWATAAKDAVVAVRFPKGPPTITGDGAAPAGSVPDGATYGVVGSFPKAKDVLRLVPDLGLDSSIDQPTCAAGHTFRATVATASAGAVDVRWPTTRGEGLPAAPVAAGRALALVDKLPLFVAHGVDELVIADPQTRELHWLVRDGDGYRPTQRGTRLDVTAADVAAQVEWPLS